jgi:hypothetical protein
LNFLESVSKNTETSTFIKIRSMEAELLNAIGQTGTHHATRHDTPIHNILSTAPQLSLFQKALGTLPEDGNVMPKHVGATINN